MMNVLRNRQAGRRSRAMAALAAWVGLALGAPAEIEPRGGSLNWNQTTRQVSARIPSWTLHEVLTRIAGTTRWEVYVEPDLNTRITTEFRNLPVGEALGKLLGQSNFALQQIPGAGARLYVYRTSVQEATRRIEAPTDADKAKNGKIGNELIVRLKPGAKIDALAKRLGAKVVGKIDGLNAYRLRFDEDASATSAREALASETDVESVESNYSITPPDQMSPLSASSNVPLNLTPNQKPDPNRIVIGLVDTAVQTQGTGLKDFLLTGISVSGETLAASDTPTHGTAMAETILRGISLAANSSEGTTTRILPVDVYGNGESTSTFQVAEGVYAAIKNGATIVNLSLGSPSESTLLYEMIRQGHQQGVVFVAAAGNEPTTAATYPAAYPEVLATTAGDKQGNLASYANRGSFVDVVAPGGNVVNYGAQSYLVTGTSTSTAYVSGLAAGMAAASGNSVSLVESQIRNSLVFKGSSTP